MGEVGQFFLAREARGTGAAAALMAAAERALVHRFGASVAFLHCVRGNARARAFYERCGFRLPLRIRRRDDGVDDNGDQDNDDDASGGGRRPISCYDERGESVVLDLADGRSARIDGLLRFTKPLDSDSAEEDDEEESDNERSSSSLPWRVHDCCVAVEDGETLGRCAEGGAAEGAASSSFEGCTQFAARYMARNQPVLVRGATAAGCRASRRTTSAWWRPRCQVIPTTT